MAVADPARPVGRNHPPPRRTVTLDRHPARHLVISGTPSRPVSRATADVGATVIGEHGTSEVLVVLGHRGGSPTLDLLGDRREPIEEIRREVEPDVRYANIAIIKGTGASRYGNATVDRG
jgi:malate/lactate dehydrogenase